MFSVYSVIWSRHDQFTGCSAHVEDVERDLKQAWSGARACLGSTHAPHREAWLARPPVWPSGSRTPRAEWTPSRPSRDPGTPSSARTRGEDRCRDGEIEGWGDGGLSVIIQRKKTRAPSPERELPRHTPRPLSDVIKKLHPHWSSHTNQSAYYHKSSLLS